MLKLIQFEMKKLLKSTYSIVLILILILSISGYFIYNYSQTMRVADEVENTESSMSTFQKGLDELEEQIESDPSLKDKPDVQSDLEFYQEWISDYEKEINALENHDWNYLLEKEIPDAKETVESNQANPLHYNMVKWSTNFTDEVRYERWVWLQENNIRPVLPFDYFSELTIYDQNFDDEITEEIVTDYANKYSSSSFYFLYRLFGVAFGVIGVVFFLFLFGDILTKEGLQRQGSIHFLYTQPISKGKVMISKYATILLSTLLIIIGAALFSTLLGAVFDRLGAWNYPVLIYEADEAFHFMPMLLFLALSALLFFMLLVFSYSLLFFFSMLLKRTTIAIGLTFGVILLGIMISKNADTSLAAYNPFHYFQVNDIISMELAAVQENFNMTLTNGLLTLGVLSGLLWLGTYAVSKIR